MIPQASKPWRSTMQIWTQGMAKDSVLSMLRWDSEPWRFSKRFTKPMPVWGSVLYSRWQAPIFWLVIENWDVGRPHVRGFNIADNMNQTPAHAVCQLADRNKGVYINAKQALVTCRANAWPWHETINFGGFGCVVSLRLSCLLSICRCCWSSHVMRPAQITRWICRFGSRCAARSEIRRVLVHVVGAAGGGGRRRGRIVELGGSAGSGRFRSGSVPKVAEGSGGRASAVCKRRFSAGAGMFQLAYINKEPVSRFETKKPYVPGVARYTLLLLGIPPKLVYANVCER